MQKFFQFLAQNKKPGNFFHLLQFNDGNCGVRLRYDPLSSELVEGKMVLKIVKPPRNKDSLSSLTGQSFAWIFNVSSPNSVKYSKIFFFLVLFIRKSYKTSLLWKEHLDYAQVCGHTNKQ